MLANSLSQHAVGSQTVDDYRIPALQMRRVVKRTIHGNYLRTSFVVFLSKTDVRFFIGIVTVNYQCRYSGVYAGGKFIE